MKLELYFQQVLRKRKISPSRSWQTVQLSIPPGKGITYYFLFFVVYNINKSLWTNTGFSLEVVIQV